MNIGYIILGYGGTALAVLFGALAAWRGGLNERLAVAVVMVGWFATPFVQTTYAPGKAIFILDVLVVLALFAISIRSRKVWSILITACAAADLVSHFADLLAPTGHKMLWAYVVTSDFVGGIFVALCLGAAAWESEWLRMQARRVATPI